VKDQTTLSACPLCGGSMSWCGDVPDEDGETHTCDQLVCVACDYNVSFNVKPENNTFETLDEQKADNARRWNRRASTNGDVSVYIASLVAERDALAEDAERYRWLRDKCGDSHLGVFKHAWDSHHRTWLSGASLDAAIDAARLSAKEPT
jgi:hypothetical protein